jgi:hypothetical protein
MHFEEDNSPTTSEGKTLYGCTYDNALTGWCDLERAEDGSCGPTGENFEPKS